LERAKQVSPQLLGGEVPYHLRKATPDLDWKIRFRIIASKASRNNKRSGIYTTTELPIREELIGLGFVERESFQHQRRIFGYRGIRGQSVYYWMDFFIPSLMLDIEADGEIWHTFFDLKKRDRRRDTILRKRYGIKVIRLNSYHIRKKRLNSIVVRAIKKRNSLSQNKV
jgi:very-short-patch-repair endonuclease